MPRHFESPTLTVRRYYAAWAAGDLAGMLERADPAIIATPILGVLYEHSTYAGHGGISEWFEEVASGWDSFEPQVTEALERDGRVIAFITLVARRREHRFDASFAVVHELVDGRIARLHGRDRFEVAEELGLAI